MVLFQIVLIILFLRLFGFFQKVKNVSTNKDSEDDKNLKKIDSTQQSSTKTTSNNEKRSSKDESLIKKKNTLIAKTNTATITKHKVIFISEKLLYYL